MPRKLLEVIEEIGLYSGQPQTCDLFDEAGRSASISFHFGDKWHSFQSLIYIRKDQLDKYLIETKKNLIWPIWGEKSVRDSGAVQSDKVNYQIFQKIAQYSGLR